MILPLKYCDKFVENILHEKFKLRWEENVCEGY